MTAEKHEAEVFLITRIHAGKPDSGLTQKIELKDGSPAVTANHIVALVPPVFAELEKLGTKQHLPISFDPDVGPSPKQCRDLAEKALKDAAMDKFALEGTNALPDFTKGKADYWNGVEWVQEPTEPGADQYSVGYRIQAVPEIGAEGITVLIDAGFSAENDAGQKVVLTQDLLLVVQGKYKKGGS